MTDKEMLLHLISKLQLKETTSYAVREAEFSVDNRRNIIIMGNGQSYSCTIFRFDSQDNLMRHAYD